MNLFIATYLDCVKGTSLHLFFIAENVASIIDVSFVNDLFILNGSLIT